MTFFSSKCWKQFAVNQSTDTCMDMCNVMRDNCNIDEVQKQLKFHEDAGKGKSRDCANCVCLCVCVCVCVFVVLFVFLFVFVCVSVCVRFRLCVCVALRACV